MTTTNLPNRLNIEWSANLKNVAPYPIEMNPSIFFWTTTKKNWLRQHFIQTDIQKAVQSVTNEPVWENIEIPIQDHENLSLDSSVNFLLQMQGLNDTFQLISSFSGNGSLRMSTVYETLVNRKELEYKEKIPITIQNTAE